MLNAGEEHLAQRRFSDAIQSFEAALRLDRDSAYIHPDGGKSGAGCYWK
jgi:hypothetical protein